MKILSLTRTLDLFWGHSHYEMNWLILILLKGHISKAQSRKLGVKVIDKSWNNIKLTSIFSDERRSKVARKMGISCSQFWSPRHINRQHEASVQEGCCQHGNMTENIWEQNIQIWFRKGSGHHITYILE